MTPTPFPPPIMLPSNLTLIYISNVSNMNEAINYSVQLCFSPSDYGVETGWYLYVCIIDSSERTFSLSLSPFYTPHLSVCVFLHVWLVMCRTCPIQWVWNVLCVCICMCVRTPCTVTTHQLLLHGCGVCTNRSRASVLTPVMSEVQELRGIFLRVSLPKCLPMCVCLFVCVCICVFV